jgi:hypothetical protein
MHDELVKLFKRAIVKQELDPLARRHLSCFMLLFNASSAAPLLSLLASLAQDLQP